MTGVDLITGTVVLVASGWLLYRSIRKSAAGCHGCDGGCHARPTSETPIVKLRRPEP